MAELITTGVWIIDEPREPAFLDEWVASAGWASSTEGAGPLRIGRDAANPDRFVSFGAWESPELVHGWKAGGELREHMVRVLQHIDNFHPTELDGVASASSGRSAVTA